MKKSEHIALGVVAVAICAFFMIGSLVVMVTFNLEPSDETLFGVMFVVSVILFFVSLIHLVRLKSSVYMQRQIEKGEKARASQIIVRTYIVGADSKTSTGSAVGRAIVGDIIAGGAGSFVGAATAKKDGMTKFLVEYADGHKSMETVPDNSARFKKLIQYVEL